MSFLSNWRQRKHKDHDLEESEVLFEESEGLLGERRSSPPLGSISTADLSGTKSTKTNSRLTRPRLIPLVVGLCIFLAGAVYYRTHGSPIALAGLVSLKTPGCFTDFRGKPLVKAPMTKKVRDSLLPEQKYMTSFSSGTFSSQIMSSMHLLQASQTSRRIAILPPFQPTHNTSKAGFIPFSHIFDISRLSRLINLPVLEWQDIKNTQHWNRLTGAAIASPATYQDGYYGGDLESVGCWSLDMARHPNGRLPEAGGVPKALSLDVSWMPVPEENFVIQGENVTEFVNIYFVSSLGFEYAREASLQKVKERYLEKVRKNREGQVGTQDAVESEIVKEIPTPSRISRSRSEPDQQLLCFDSLADTATHSTEEATSEYSPTWNIVGRHLHFSSELKKIADSVLRSMLSLPSSSSSDTDEPTMPAYIAVDVRRHEFDSAHSVSLSAYEDAVSSLIKNTTSSSMDLSSLPVVVVSDEGPLTTTSDTDSFWADLSQTASNHGWKILDVTQTQTRFDKAGRFGEWYSTLVNEAILGYASGFVGTKGSRNSELAGVRVRSWAKGDVRMI